MAERDSNPGPLMTTMISSAVGGGAMQVGAVATTKLLNWATNRNKKGRNRNPEERVENPLGNLPAKAARQWEAVYNSALDRGFDQAAAAQQAWCAVKRHYHKKGDRWLKRKQPLGRHEYPPGCTPKALNPESSVDVRRLKSKLLR